MTRDMQYLVARVQISGSKQAVVKSFVARTEDSVTVFGDHCDSQYQTLNRFIVVLNTYPRPCLVVPVIIAITESRSQRCSREARGC